jgi:C4-dicarboxylate-specific signal transduction histidine kinase
LATYIAWAWGVIVPQSLLIFILVIVMSSILINSNFSLRISLVSSLTLILLSYLQINNFVKPELYWLNQNLISWRDTFVHVVIFGVIAVISWLFNSEMEKALERARQSEKELKQERDLLEIKVEERTEELKKAELEKINNLYRFAKFGKLSSGIFHDLVNPLTALALNLEQVEKEETNNIQNAKKYLTQAIGATKRMESFIGALKKQISQQNCQEFFSLNREIQESIEILGYKARKNNVQIKIYAKKEIHFYGNPLEFSQVITNIISNAIDAHKNQEKKDKWVKIILLDENQEIKLSIKDNAGGIEPNILPKIFEPFFSTKNFSEGLGLGLASCQNIIEKKFKGSIKVKSNLGEGSKFIIKLPNLYGNGNKNDNFEKS